MAHRKLRALLAAGAIAAGAAGLIIASLSFYPYESAKARADAVSQDGVAQSFTPEFYQGIVGKARLFGLVVAAGAGVMFWKRRALADGAAARAREIRDYLREEARALRAGLKAEDPLHLGALAMVIAMGFALRLRYLNQYINGDEASTFLSYATTPFLLIASNYLFPNNHILNSLLVRVCFLIGGGQPWVLRLPALAAGAALMPATYLFARAHYDKYSGLLAAGLTATSCLQILYSTTARGYSMVSLAFALLMILAPRIKDRDPAGPWLLFAVIAALGFYAIPIMLYPAGAVFLWLALTRALGQSSLPLKTFAFNLGACLVLTGTISILLYAPVMVVSGVSALVANRFVAPLDFSEFTAKISPSLVSTFRQWNQEYPVWLTVLLSAGVAVSLALHPLLGRHKVPLVPAAIMFITPVVILQRVVPYERVWLFALVLYFGTGAAGLMGPLARVWSARPRAARLALNLVPVVVAGWLGARTLARHDFLVEDLLQHVEPAVLYLHPRLGPDDRVAVSGSFKYSFRYYFYRHGFSPDCFEKTRGRKLWLVTQEPTETEVEAIISELGLDPGEWTARVPVTRIGEIDIGFMELKSGPPGAEWEGLKEEGEP